MHARCKSGGLCLYKPRRFCSNQRFAPHHLPSTLFSHTKCLTPTSNLSKMFQCPPYFDARRHLANLRIHVIDLSSSATRWRFHPYWGESRHVINQCTIHEFADFDVSFFLNQALSCYFIHEVYRSLSRTILPLLMSLRRRRSCALLSLVILSSWKILETWKMGVRPCGGKRQYQILLEERQ